MSQEFELLKKSAITEISNDLQSQFNSAANSLAASVDNKLSQWEADRGLTESGDFDTGFTATERQQIFLYNGEWYRWDGALPKVVPPASTPATTGGVVKGAWRSVGDAALRSLYSGLNGAGHIKQATMQVSSIFNLVNLPANVLRDDLLYNVDSVYTDSFIPAGLYKYDSNLPKSNNNGRTVIAHGLSFNGTRSDLANLVPPTPGGSGCFVLVREADRKGSKNRQAFFDKHADQFRIVSHRGCFFTPENTVIAIQQLPYKLYAVETDYRKTSDGEFVIIHDDTVNRTTDGTGSVGSLTFNQARQLDAGSWFDPRYEGEKLPTIGEYITACRRKGVRYIFLQPYGMSNSSDALKSINEVKAVGGVSNVVFMANNIAQARLIREVDDEVIIGLFGNNTGNIGTNLRQAIGYNVSLMLSSPGDASFTSNKVIYPLIKDAGIIPGTSTLNNAELMREASQETDACFSLTDMCGIHRQFERGTNDD